MKILIIHNHWLEEGGEDKVVNSEIKLLRNYGHQVVVYIRSNREFRCLSVRDKVRFFLYDIKLSPILLVKDKPKKGTLDLVN